MRNKQTGLTLIEIMIAVAILAILALVAYPLYTEQARKSRRTDARVALQTLAQAQERYFTIYGEYASSAALDDPNQDSNDDDSMSDDILNRVNPNYYTIVISPPPPTTAFTITATATGSQSGDTACQEFSIDQNGTLLSEDNNGNDSTDTCW